MGYKVIPELKRLKSLERGRIEAHPADYTVALVYPNTYYVGMSNLGFQLVYGLLNSLPGVRCERGFFFEGQETRTVEGLKHLRSFDCVAFPLSYELDYFRVVDILRRSKFKLAASERGEEFPLIIGGGLCAWLNPEPVADIFDLFVLGEAEAVLPELFRVLRDDREKGRDKLLRSAAMVPGVYVPGLFKPRYDENGRFIATEAIDGSIPLPKRRWVDNLDAWPARAPIVTPETDFSGKNLIEAMRGCRRQCRFCVADYAYRSPRLRSRRSIMKAVREGMPFSKGVAVVGPCLSDHPEIEDICTEIVNSSCSISVSSMRADCVTDVMLETLARGGLRSLTIAPETPSERLQRKLNKVMAQKHILQTADRARAAGLKEIKLYYMVGIEGEEEDDLAAIAEQVNKVASLLPTRVSIGALIPKAHSPLQWLGMQEEGQLRKKYRFLQKRVAKIPRVKMSGLSIRGAMIEASLARGDRRLTRYIIDGRLPRKVRDSYALAEREVGETLPWEHIDVGVDRGYLLKEYRSFCKGETTEPCQPDDCRLCGVCR